MPRFLYVSTRDGDTASNYDNAWNIADFRLNNIGYYSIALHSVEFPNTVYPINIFQNTIHFDEGAGVLQAIIPSNNYTGTALASAIKTQMDLAGTDTYTVTYDTISKLMRIQSTGTFYLQYGDGSSVDGSMLEELGIEPFTTPTNDKTGEYPVNLSGTRYVNLQTNLGNFNYSTGTTSNILARIPLNVPFGNIIYYQPPFPTYVHVASSSLNSISVQLKDDKGHPFQLPGNAHMTLSFIVEALPDVHENAGRVKNGDTDSYKPGVNNGGF